VEFAIVTTSKALGLMVNILGL